MYYTCYDNKFVSLLICLNIIIVIKFISQKHHHIEMEWGFLQTSEKEKEKKNHFFIIQIYKQKALPPLLSQISKESFIADEYNFLKNKM